MLGFQARVIDEYAQLVLKINALEEFIKGAIFETLDIRQQGLLIAQLDAMGAYAHCLEVRISYFGE
ncbi:hypothetical protein [Enterobacteria phage vB_EcoM_IME281]|uniref:Uncharacterized protein n=1 Tax=Enterobacteria phage vB_EcoM_IME281 TaxID=2163887 RepID=A0A2S1GNQ6_9CAUD|nr:hypothetical protein KNT84_gp004 [Enterobacteria phage vB_EcoM_IME281]AWD91014.1 hypothetical protein [Enterobacteria phage vB_EcoM_IME281]